MTTAYMPEARQRPPGSPPLGPSLFAFPTPTSRRLRLERGLERLHALFLEMSAKLIDAMDDATPDADLEPSLAGFGPFAGSGDDREEEDEREDGHDAEDDLGWGAAVDQRRLGRGADELEPSLGSLGSGWAGFDQTLWAHGGDDFIPDGEEQCEDEGGADDRENDQADCG